MHTKKDASFMITVLLSMIILAYITFVTVYEQILSQNNGFFNVIIFGVVLILVFIFITLLARVITVKNNNQEQSPVLRVLIIFLIIGIFVLFFMSRLRYTSSLYPSDYPVYRAADYITSGNLMEGKDIHNHLISYPADFVYAYFLSNIFSITGASAEAYVITNISMMIILAAFLFFTVNLLAGKAYAAVAVIVCLFMPNHMFLVYTYNSELFVAALFMAMYFLFSVLIYKRFKSNSIARIIALLCGIFAGLCVSCEPVVLLAILIMTVWVLNSQRQTTLCALIPLIVSIMIMAALIFLKSLLLNVPFVDVLLGICFCFVPTYIRDSGADQFTLTNFFNSLSSRLNSPSKFLSDTFYFLTEENGNSFSSNQAIWLKLADQLIYIFLLVLCVLCIVYILRVMYDKIVPSLAVLVVLFLGQLLGGANQVNYIYFITIIIVIASTTIYYMYLNHHPDYAVIVTNAEIRKDNEIKLIKEGAGLPDESEEDDTSAEEITDEDLLRARALVFLGENEQLYAQIKEEERDRRINNPIATTRIKTTLNEQGEYDSVEEHVEFFDELDEKVDVAPVHEVKAIPSTRPVEVVKPILADDYENTIQKNESNEDDSLEPFDEPDTSPKNDIDTGGFVFRKKEPKEKNTEATNIKATKLKEPKIKEQKVKEPKIKESKKLVKNKSLDDVKPGEPLPNPLKGPKPHVSKDLKFDYDVNTEDDDFDW